MLEKPSRTIGPPEHSVVARTPSAGALLGEGNDGTLPTLILRYLDVLVVVLGVPLALALGAPAFGVLVGAGAWLLQRVVAAVDRKAIVRAAEPGSRLGLNFIDAFARIWLLAAGIVVAGTAGSRHDGLAAALVILAGYSIAFAVRIARGREAGPS
jgi:hypothetical protein